MKTKIFFAFWLLLATGALAQNAQPKSDNVAINAGPTIPALWSIDLLRLKGAFYYGLQVQGDYEIPNSDKSSSKLTTFNFIGGGGIGKSASKFLRRFRSSGGGAFLGSGITTTSYNSSFPPFHFGVFLNLSYPLSINKTLSFAPYVRPIYSVLLLGRDQRGIFTENQSQEGWYIDIGGGLVF